MCHATKKIKCDMQDDEYFESHYKVSQGLLDDGYDLDIVFFQSLLFSKCQKDRLSTVSKFCYC